MQALVLDFLGEGSQEKRNGAKGGGGEQETAGGKKLSKDMVSGINSHQPDPTRSRLEASKPVFCVLSVHWSLAKVWEMGKGCHLLCQDPPS